MLLIPALRLTELDAEGRDTPGHKLPDSPLMPRHFAVVVSSSRRVKMKRGHGGDGRVQARQGTDHDGWGVLLARRIVK